MNSSISLDDRERMILSGVRSVDSVTDTMICIFTADGDLVIRGEGLRADEFDSDGGILHINGRIDSIRYTTDKRHLPDNMITKLFR